MLSRKVIDKLQLKPVVNRSENNNIGEVLVLAEDRDECYALCDVIDKLIDYIDRGDRTGYLGISGNDLMGVF